MRYFVPIPLRMLLAHQPFAGINPYPVVIAFQAVIVGNLNQLVRPCLGLAFARMREPRSEAIAIRDIPLPHRRLSNANRRIAANGSEGFAIAHALADGRRKLGGIDLLVAFSAAAPPVCRHPVLSAWGADLGVDGTRWWRWLLCIRQRGTQTRAGDNPLLKPVGSQIWRRATGLAISAGRLWLNCTGSDK